MVVLFIVMLVFGGVYVTYTNINQIYISNNSDNKTEDSHKINTGDIKS